MSQENDIKAAIAQGVAETRGEAQRATPLPPVNEPAPAGDPPPTSPTPTRETPPTPKPKPGTVRRGSRRGQIVRCADGSERNIAQAWADLFSANENLPPTSRLDDDAILERMRELFPGREESRLFAQVGRMRAAYNAGRLAGQKGKPTKKSWRYRQTEPGVVYRLNSRGSAVELIANEAAPKPRRQRSSKEWGKNKFKHLV